MSKNNNQSAVKGTRQDPSQMPVSLSKAGQKIYDTGSRCGFCRHWGACKMQCHAKKARTK